MTGRINKVIELLESGQPVYQVGSHTGNVLTYEAGLEAASTWADFVNVGMEHGAFDMPGLDQFMRGLVDGGPTKSGMAVSADTCTRRSWSFPDSRRKSRRGARIC